MVDLSGMAHDSRYSMARPPDLRRTVRFVRRAVLDEAVAKADAPSAADPGDEDAPAAVVTTQVLFGKHELTIERWGDHVRVRVPGGSRLAGTREQVAALIAALTAAAT